MLVLLLEKTEGRKSRDKNTMEGMTSEILWPDAADVCSSCEIPTTLNSFMVFLL